MFEENLTLEDQVSAPIALSTEPGDFIPCMRVVWRKIGSEFHAVGWFYCVENAYGLVAVLDSPLKAIGKAQNMNRVPPLQVSILVRIGQIEPNDIGAPTEIVANVRFVSDEPIPVKSLTLGRVMASARPHPRGS